MSRSSTLRQIGWLPLAIVLAIVPVVTRAQTNGALPDAADELENVAPESLGNEGTVQPETPTGETTNSTKPAENAPADNTEKSNSGDGTWVPPVVVYTTPNPKSKAPSKPKLKTASNPAKDPASSVDAVGEIVDPDASEKSALTVTARKRIDNPKDVPFGLTTKTRADLEATGATRVREVIRDVPNINVSGFGDGRSTSFIVRGIGALRDPLSPGDTSFIVYVDGVPQPLFASDVGFLDLHQVELLKGPQGTLFGRNTTAGALNVTTSKPGDTPEFSVRGEIGTDGYFMSEAIASGPIIERVLAGRLALRKNGLKGFVPNVLTRNDLGEQDVLAGRGTLRFTPERDTAFTLSLAADHDTRTFSFFVLRDAPEFPIAALVADPGSKRQYKTATLTIERKADVFAFKSITGLTHYRTIDLFVDDTEGFIFEKITGFPNEFFATNDSFTFWNEKRTTFSQEVLFSSLPGDITSWVVGASYFNSQFEADYLNRNIVFFGLNGRRQNDLDTNSIAGFGEITVPVGFGFSVTTGARATHERKTYDLRYTGIGTPGTVDTFRDAGELEYTFATGRTSLSYDVTRDAKTYLTASRGYKTGGYPRFVNDASLGIATPPFSETTTWTYEAGYKYRPTSNAAVFDAALFYNDISDEHLLAFDPAIFSFRPANLDVVTYGLELSAALQLTQALKIAGGFGYTRAKFVNIDAAGALAGERNGNRPTNVPKRTANAALHYRQSGEDLGLVFNGDVFGHVAWEHVGERAADVANSFFLGAYNIVNGRVGVEPVKNFEVYLFGKNLLDEAPQLAGAFVPPDVEVSVPGRGRVVGIGTFARW